MGGAPPNVLVAISDDQSFWHTSINGEAAVRTPAFDRVAREGVNFTYAYANAPSCAPSRAAMLTGRHVWQLEEASVLNGSFPAKFPTFQDELAKAGYHCGYTGKAWGPGLWSAGDRETDPGGKIYRDAKLENAPGGVSTSDYAADFAEFLAERKPDQPFSFIFGCHEPHRPYKRGIGVESGLDPATVTVPPFLPDTPGVRRDICDYLYEIQWFDRMLGAIVKQIEATGELDNTLVIVTSDNGMPFPRAKSNLYDAGVRVPFAVRWGSRVPPGRRIDDFVSLADIAPTVLEAVGVRVPDTVTSRSLMPLLLSNRSGRVEPARDFIVTAIEFHNNAYPIRMLRTHDFAYLVNCESERWRISEDSAFVWGREPLPMDKHAGARKGMDASAATRMLRSDPAIAPLCEAAFGKRPAEELHDMRADPWQMRNLAVSPDHAETLRQLRGKLTMFLKQTGDPRYSDAPVVFEQYPRYTTDWKKDPRNADEWGRYREKMWGYIRNCRKPRDQ